MLSLKKTIEGLNLEEERYRAALECYLAALHAVQEHAVEVTAEVTYDFQLQVRTLHRELCDDSGLPALQKSRVSLVALLQGYQARTAESLSKKEDDLRAIIETLGTAAETLGGHNDSHSTRLRDFTSQLQLVARGTDLSKMRGELSRRVAELRSVTDSIWRENQSSVSNMQVQLTEFHKRLERAESRATIDALTGLINRGEGELRLRKAIGTGHQVSIILIDLNGFKQVNDHWGHSAGDQVLKAFASALTQSVRPTDSACRWGGDEFLVMMNGNEEIARERALKLRAKLRMMHKLVVLGRIIEVDVSASLGVAQARSGEPLEDLLTRADVELYGHKNPAKLHAATLMTTPV